VVAGDDRRGGLDRHACPGRPARVGYVGTQAAFVFVVTLIQGPAPPSSIMAGVDRFAGIVGGLAILLIVSLLLWPTDAEQAEAR
jgi:hypothetical protein